MKKILLTSFFAILPYYANATQYEQNWNPYIGMNFGICASDVTVHDEDFFDFGGVYNFEVGTRYKERVRLALNYQTRAEVSEFFQVLLGHSISITNDAIRVNAYYDYVSLNWFSMYIGAGIGGDRYSYKITDRADNSTLSKHGYTFTGGVSTGLSFRLWQMHIDLGAVFDYIAEPEIYSYGPNIGIRYYF